MCERTEAVPFGEPVLTLAHLHTGPSPPEESLALTTLVSATTKSLRMHSLGYNSQLSQSSPPCQVRNDRFQKRTGISTNSGARSPAKKEEYRHLVFSSGKHSL